MTTRQLSPKRRDRIIAWFEQASSWPIRTVSGFIYWVCFTRGVVVVFSLVTGLDIHGVEVLLACGLFVWLLKVVWPREGA